MNKALEHQKIYGDARMLVNH